MTKRNSISFTPGERFHRVTFYDYKYIRERCRPNIPIITYHYPDYNNPLYDVTIFEKSEAMNKGLI